MIHLGLKESEKPGIVAEYVAAHDIKRIFVFSPKKWPLRYLDGRCEHLDWAEVTFYKHFYRLLQQIDDSTLMIFNECLRLQNRYDLGYNCARNYLNQTTHQLIFQYLPIIDAVDDFMILFDLETRSRWKREKFNPSLLGEATVGARPVDLGLTPISVKTDAKTREFYQREKRKLIDGIGLKDPHTIPRNLYLLSGKAKLREIDPAIYYIGRNNRFKIPNLATYKEDSYTQAPYTVFEFCHNFIDFADFLSLSGQVEIPVLIADLKVDQWYLQRYQAWLGRINDAYSAIQQR